MEEEKEDVRLGSEWTKQESRWVAFGALRGALLIGSIYLIAGALLIALLLAIWK